MHLSSFSLVWNCHQKTWASKEVQIESEMYKVNKFVFGNSSHSKCIRIKWLLDTFQSRTYLHLCSETQDCCWVNCGGEPFVDLFSLKNLQSKEERKLRRKLAKQASKDQIITDSNDRQEEGDAAREEQRSQEGNILWKKAMSSPWVPFAVNSVRHTPLCSPIPLPWS